MKLFEKSIFQDKYEKKVELKIINIPLFQYEKTNKDGIIHNKLKVFPTKTYRNKELDKIITAFANEKFDIVFLYRIDALGEIYLLAQMIDEYVEKNKIKNIGIVTCKKTVFDVCRIFIPHIKCYLFKEYSVSMFNFLFNTPKFKYNNINFIVYPQTFPEAKFLYRECYTKRNMILPFTNYILDKFNLESFRLNLPTYSVDFENVKKKFPKDFDFNNFIVLIPEANSVLELSKDFWQAMYDKIKAEGYSIFINSTSSKYNFNNSIKLNIEESMLLSEHAKSIVSLRTGFLELLLCNDVPKHVIYTRRRRDPMLSTKMKEIFTLDNYPKKTAPIVEYCTDNISEENIIREILESLSSHK